MYSVFKLRLIIVGFLFESVYNTLVNLLYVYDILIILKSKPTYFRNSLLKKYLNGLFDMVIKRIFSGSGVHKGRTINRATL